MRNRPQVRGGEGEGYEAVFTMQDFQERLGITHAITDVWTDAYGTCVVVSVSTSRKFDKELPNA